MRVAMKKTILEGHPEDRVGPHRSHPPALGGHEHKRSDVVETGPLYIFRRKDPRGSVLQVDFRDHNLGVGKVEREPPGVFRFAGIVQLPPDDTIELRNEARHVHEDPASKPPV